MTRQSRYLYRKSTNLIRKSFVQMVIRIAQINHDLELGIPRNQELEFLKDV